MQIVEKEMPSSDILNLYDMRNNKVIPMLRKRIGKSVVMIALASSLLVPSAQAATLNTYQIVRFNPAATVVDSFSLTRLFIDKNEITENGNLRLNQAIHKNSNLSDFEKGIMAQFKPFIEENPYTGEDNLINFDSVQFQYDNTRSRSQYFSETNTCTMQSNNDDVFFHELMHCFSDNRKENRSGLFGLTKPLKNISFEMLRKCNEGMTELLTDEYIKPNNPHPNVNGYGYEKAYMKVIIELIGKDKVLEAYTTANLNVIVDELANYLEGYNSESAINNATKFLNCLSKHYDQYMGYADTEISAIENEELSGYMNYIYQKKYEGKKDFSKDLLVQHYLSEFMIFAKIITSGDYQYRFTYETSNYYHNVTESMVTIYYYDYSGIEEDKRQNTLVPGQLIGTYSVSEIQSNYDEFFNDIQNNELINKQNTK